MDLADFNNSIFFTQSQNASAGIITASASFSTEAIAGKDLQRRMAYAVRMQDSPCLKRYRVISRLVSPNLYMRTTLESIMHFRVCLVLNKNILACWDTHTNATDLKLALQLGVAFYKTGKRA